MMEKVKNQKESYNKNTEGTQKPTLSKAVFSSNSPSFEEVDESEFDLEAQRTFRTIPSNQNPPPTVEEFKIEAQKIDLKKYSVELATDLCNLAGGGKTTSPSQFRDIVQKQIIKKLEPKDGDGEWKLHNHPRKGYTKELSEVIDDRLPNAMSYHQNVIDFIKTIDLEKFPGQTPIEKAMGVLKLMSQNSECGGTEAGGIQLPIFSDANSSQNLAKDINETIEMMDGLSQEEIDLMDPEDNFFYDKEGARVNEDRKLSKREIAYEMQGGLKEVLQVSRKLDKLSPMKLASSRKMEADPAGSRIRNRRMRDLSELSKINVASWMDMKVSKSYFWYKAVENNYKGQEKAEVIEKKQVVFILVDGSGSMSEGNKHLRSSGIVMNRLKGVLKGDAVVFLTLYSQSISTVYKVETPEDARQMMAKYVYENFDGGGTDTANCLRQAYNYIKNELENPSSSNYTFYKPEIILITDEDNSIKNIKTEEMPGVKVHGFSMSVKNQAMVDFARSTGGVGFDNF